MEYHIYTTPAIVLARAPSGEANTSVWLLTQDYGLVRAHAQRARDITSKLRFGLQLFSLSTVSLVHGRSRWRVVNAIPRRSYAKRLLRHGSRMSIASKLALTLRHLVAGEEADRELFHIFYTTLNWLSCTRGHTLADEQTAERIALVRVLYRLGYIDRDKVIAPVLVAAGCSAALITEMRPHQAAMTRMINQALEASHLSPAQPHAFSQHFRKAH